MQRLVKPWIGGAAVAGLAFAVSACGNGMSFRIGDEDGVRLADLDTGGPAPTKLVVAGPDNVIVTQGDTLDIKVSGDAKAIDALRFNLEDGTLGILRDDSWKGPGKATIAVTMPATEEIVLAGSGDIRAPTMVERAEVNIAGSGNVAVARVAASQLDVNVMGSGTFSAAGTAEQLDFNVAGSGKLAARGLKVQRAEVNIAGSGGGEFASDGRVNANVAGSGDVTVYGSAQCKISAMGSGKLRCVHGTAPSWTRTPPAAASGAAPRGE